MHRATKALLFCVVIFAVFTPHSWAALPLITDDTGTQGKGRFQLEAWVRDEHDKETVSGISVKDSSIGIATTLTYGLVDTVDLGLTVPYKWIKEEADGVTVLNAKGISDSLLEAKWRFYKYKTEGLSFALKPGVILPTGNEHKDLGAGRTGYGAFFIATQELKLWTFDVNLGYVRNNNTVDERNDLWFVSLAAHFDVAKNLKLVAETGLATNTNKGSDSYPVFLQGGFVYSLAEQVDLSFGVLVGLNSAAPDYSFRPGVTVRF